MITSGVNEMHCVIPELYQGVEIRLHGRRQTGSRIEVEKARQFPLPIVLVKALPIHFYV